MKDLTQPLTWSTLGAIVASIVVCRVLTALMLPGAVKLNSRFILLAIILAGTVACLIASYRYLVKKGANKVRARLYYAMVGLLIILAFVFLEAKTDQEKQVISDVCAQFDLAIGGGDYETAYGFMSPHYRQGHSLAQFMESKFVEGNGNGARITCGHRSKSVTVLLLHPGATAASITHTPLGSLNTEIILRRVDGQWFFTGNVRDFSG